MVLGLWALYLFSLGTSMAGMELFSSLLSLVGLIAALRRREFPFPTIVRPLALFSLIVMLGIWLGEAPSELKRYDLSRIRFFVVFLGIYLSLRFYFPGYRRIINILAVTTALVGIYGAIQHFIPLDLVRPEGKKAIQYAVETLKVGPLTNGTFNHHLTFSNIYLFYALLFLSIGLYVPKMRWALALGGLLFVDVLWTQSRAAWISAPVVLVALVVPKGKRVVVAVVSGFILFALFAYSVDAGLRERLARTRLSSPSEHSLLDRTRLWHLQIDLFKQNPLIGVGWNNNERRCTEEMQARYPDIKNIFCGHAHSLFFQILATTGLFGLLAFVWLWVSVVHATWQGYRRHPEGTLPKAMALGVLVGWLGFFLQGMTQWNFGDAEVLHNVIFFWALAAVLSEKVEA